MNYAIQRTDLFGASSSNFTGILGGATTGVSTGTTSTGSGSGVGTGILNSLGAGFVTGLIGSIKNLINCWGVTWQPSRAENFVSQRFPIFQSDVQLALQADDPIPAINQAVNDFRATYSRDEAWLKRCEDPATGCSAETLTAMTDELLSGIKQVLIEVASQVNGAVVQTTYSHTDRNGVTRCGETFKSWKLEQRNTSTIGQTVGTIQTGMQKLGFAGLLPFALMGSLAYYFVKGGNKKSKSKNQWFKK